MPSITRFFLISFIVGTVFALIFPFFVETEKGLLSLHPLSTLAFLSHLRDIVTGIGRKAVQAKPTTMGRTPVYFWSVGGKYPCLRQDFQGAERSATLADTSPGCRRPEHDV